MRLKNYDFSSIEDLSGRRTSRYRRRPGLFSFDAIFDLLATAGTIGAGAILVLSAQLLWCSPMG